MPILIIEFTLLKQLWAGFFSVWKYRKCLLERTHWSRSSFIHKLLTRFIFHLILVSSFVLLSAGSIIGSSRSIDLVYFSCSCIICEQFVQAIFVLESCMLKMKFEIFSDTKTLTNAISYSSPHPESMFQMKIIHWQQQCTVTLHDCWQDGSIWCWLC